MKNPKDAMALQSFGRNIAVCLAAGDGWEGHGKKPGAIGPRGGEGKA